MQSLPRSLLDPLPPRELREPIFWNARSTVQRPGELARNGSRRVRILSKVRGE